MRNRNMKLQVIHLVSNGPTVIPRRSAIILSLVCYHSKTSVQVSWSLTTKCYPAHTTTEHLDNNRWFIWISFSEDGLARSIMNKAMEGEDRAGPRQSKAGPGLYPPPFLGPAPHTDLQFYQVIKAARHGLRNKQVYLGWILLASCKCTTRQKH